MENLNNVTDYGAKIINNSLNNELIRYLVLIITGVLAGYTLQPVPKWLNNQFDNNVVLKGIILALIGAVALYPVDKDKLKIIFFGTIIILLIFKHLRKYD